MLEGRWEQAQQYLPQNVWQLYRQAQQDGQLADLQLGERAMLSALRRMEQKEMAQLADLSEGLENRLYRASREACSLEQLYAAVKSKRYPLARVRRLVMNAFLQLPAQMQTLSPPYLRVLGMNERGKQILSAMKKTASLPVSTSLMKLARSTEAAHQWAQAEAAACDQYRHRAATGVCRLFLCWSRKIKSRRALPQQQTDSGSAGGKSHQVGA